MSVVVLDLFSHCKLLYMYIIMHNLCYMDKVWVKLYQFQNSDLFFTSCIPMTIPGGILSVVQLYQACYQTPLEKCIVQLPACMYQMYICNPPFWNSCVQACSRTSILYKTLILTAQQFARSPLVSPCLLTHDQASPKIICPRMPCISLVLYNGKLLL